MFTKQKLEQKIAEHADKMLQPAMIKTLSADKQEQARKFQVAVYKFIAQIVDISSIKDQESFDVCVIEKGDNAVRVVVLALSV